MMGFLWIGTADGLNRYDGYEFVTMRQDPADPSSISDNEVMSVLDDKKGNIWIGNAAGVDLLNVETEICRHFSFDPNNEHSLSNSYVTGIFQDHKGDIWIGTAEGLNEFDYANDRFVRHYINQPHTSDQNVIRSIQQLSSAKLLIGTGEGLFLFDMDTRQFKHITDDKLPDESINTCLINTIIHDKDQNVWIGTDMGIFKYDSEFKNYTHYTSQNSRLSNNFIRCGLQRKDGTLWFGTENGLSQYDPTANSFHGYHQEAGQPHSLSNNTVHSILEDNAGNLWIGTGSGLNRLDPFSFQFNPLLIYPFQKNDLVNNKVWAIEESDQHLWIGTEGGLHVFDSRLGKVITDHSNRAILKRLNNTIVRSAESTSRQMYLGTEGDGLLTFTIGKNNLTSYRTAEDDSTSISDNIIRVVKADQDDDLWIGTGCGLSHFNPATQKFRRFYFDIGNNNLKINSIRDLKVDADFLWVGTEEGLIRFNKATGETDHFHHATEDPTSLSHNFVRTIFMDQSGILWIGTSGGLNKYDSQKKIFKCYKMRDGLANEVIYAILEDGNQHLWISTNKGLSRFNPRDETFFNYNVNDGLQSYEFNTNAACKDSKGQLIFGGINGLNIFSAENIRENNFQAPILLTGFDIFNKKADIGEDMPLRKSIMMADTVFLNYRDNLFTFRYSAIDFISAPKTEYQYQLEGFDKNWNHVGHRRYATYTNIPMDWPIVPAWWAGTTCAIIIQPCWPFQRP